MLRNFLFLLGVLCAGLMHNASAQLVFVPDTNLRAYLDSVMPGVVDANGYIDSNGPQALGATQLAIGANWSPMDLTGIEAFANLIWLHIGNADNTFAVDVVSFGNLPPGLLQLGLTDDISLAALPPLPATLETLYIEDVEAVSYTHLSSGTMRWKTRCWLFSSSRN